MCLTRVCWVLQTALNENSGWLFKLLFLKFFFFFFFTNRKVPKIIHVFALIMTELCLLWQWLFFLNWWYDISLYNSNTMFLGVAPCQYHVLTYIITITSFKLHHALIPCFLSCTMAIPCFWMWFHGNTMFLTSVMTMAFFLYLHYGNTMFLNL